MAFRKSYIWAGLFALGMAGWLASGQLNGNQPETADAGLPEKVEKKAETLFSVEVAEFVARDRQAVITARGQTEEFDMVDVRNRVAGIVEDVAISAGQFVQAGEPLCELDRPAKTANLARAKAELASSKRDFEAAQQLAKDKFSSEASVATLKAKYDAAAAAMVQAEQEMAWTHVTAPVQGTIAEPPAERGAFLQTGQLCARIAILDPIKVAAWVGERDIAHLQSGQETTVSLVTGDKLTGKVIFISPISDLQTRTFKVEVEAPNPQRKIRAGITASLNFALPASQAHLLPTHLISLNEAGEIGVRALVNGDTVKFLPVKLIKHTRKGIWVDGLPPRVKLITVGQDYVLDGQKVIAKPAAKLVGDAAS